MPRKDVLPPHELAICRRLRDFRKATLIPRAMFAVSVGVTSDRLSAIENERVPVRFDIFESIHHQYFVSPMFLVEGKGTMAYAAPLHFPYAELTYNPRDLLSVCYRQGLQKIAREHRGNLMSSLQSPGGFARRIEEYIEFFNHPGVFDAFDQEDLREGIAKLDVLLVKLRGQEAAMLKSELRVQEKAFPLQGANEPTSR